MCTGFPPAAFCNHCKEFKLPDMRNLYERERLSKFEKKKKNRNGNTESSKIEERLKSTNYVIT